ncbi:claudin-15-like isoform X1 [Astyanax mexicanus]|uniref:Claudin n=2 Tax=Astyanax mexicanus TaxID=7994 RepID=A0A8B9JDP8_ASTMX|nr:claudin-15-like isoform X1 [Astyanax mexicanus]KAG9281502.1 claudin-15-like isoform X1 [Astyanax mexicanus]
MNAAVEAMAFFLGFFGWVMAGVAIPNRFWRVAEMEGNVITAATVYENLWMSCLVDSTAVHNCQDFPSMLGLSGHVQASRALMIASIVLGTFGLVATLVGMQCSKIGGDNYILKGRTAALGGIFFILQGLCTMIAVSWYAFNITQEFFDPLYPGTKFELGQGLYIGWCSATLALLGGTCLLCSCSVTTKEKKLSYAYRGPTRGTAYTTSVTTTTPHPYDRNAYV